MSQERMQKVRKKSWKWGRLERDQSRVNEKTEGGWEVFR